MNTTPQLDGLRLEKAYMRTDSPDTILLTGLTATGEITLKLKVLDLQKGKIPSRTEQAHAESERAIKLGKTTRTTPYTEHELRMEGLPLHWSADWSQEQLKLHKTAEQAARFHGYSPEAFRRSLAERHNHPTASTLKAELKSQVLQDHTAGLTFMQLWAKYQGQISKSTLSLWLKGQQ